MLLLGFDIGGTKCAVSLGEAQGNDIRIAARKAFPTPSPWSDALEAMFSAAEELLDGRKPDACGFSCGGPLDARSGIVLSPPNLPGWDRVPLTARAEARFGVPCALENDANACALAEWRWGAGKGSHDMAFLTFGTGLGAGLILDDRLIRGAHGNAGEVGHIRLSPFGPSGYGKAGSFEGFCSGGGIAQLAVTLGREAQQRGRAPSYFKGSWDEVTAKNVALAARGGDETARAVYDMCADMLGRGLSYLVDIVDVETIVLGSIFVRCRDLLEETLWRTLRREALPSSLEGLRIVPAALGEDLGDYAALSCAAGAL